MPHYNPAHHRPTPAWAIIGLLTSLLILILEATLFQSRDIYASYIVGLTYTSAIMATCFFTLLGHLLVRRYPRLAPYLNIGFDLASVMTLGGGGGRRMTEGRRRASIGRWVENTPAPAMATVDAPPLQRAVTRDSEWATSDGSRGGPEP